MKFALYINLALWLTPLMLKAQIAAPAHTKQANWQQRVNHTILANLDATGKTLSINQEIEYINNSNSTLNELYFHVWPYAFSAKNTEFGKEATRTGLKSFVNASKEELSKISKLSFSINGKEITPVAHPKWGMEVVKLVLHAPLAPGKSVLINNTFISRVPALFSRYGQQNGFYSITQWYPKPAVYDVNGWHVFPYQSIGEYYSEYGNYDVSITLNDSFWVAATGNPQGDYNFSAWKNKTTKNGNTTYVFKQENVHDFAWFASQDFEHESTNAQLDGRSVICNAFLGKEHTIKTPKEVASSIKKGVEYYSKRVGNYLYDYCTAVIGPLEGAGGMEYPMITVCTDAEPSTVVHEVGHNWFQGILGTNERDYPWMDESINTYYQNQSMAENSSIKMNQRYNVGGGMGLPLIAQITGLYQVTALHSNQYSNSNYGFSIYMNGPLQFSYLEEVIGTKLFDSCMQTYFSKWKLKHPLPKDMQAVFESICNRSMAWFFDGILAENPKNFKIKSHKKQNEGSTLVTIKNEGLPVTYRYVKNFIGYNRVAWSDTIMLEKNATNLELNPNGYYMESNMDDNYWPNTKNGLYHTQHFGLGDMGKRGIKSTWLLPNLFTFNINDGYTPGLILSSLNLPSKKWEFVLAPSYGLKSKTLVGQAKIQRNIISPSPKIALITTSIAASRYSFFPVEINNSTDMKLNLNQYLRIKPEIKVLLPQKNHWQTSISASFTQAQYNKNNYSLKFINKDSFINFAYGKDRLRQVASLLWKKELFSKLAPQTISAEASYGLGAYARGIIRYKLKQNIRNRTKKDMFVFAELFGVYNDCLDPSQYHANLLIGSAPMLYDAAFNDINSYRSPNRNINLSKFGYSNYTSTVPSIRFPVDLYSRGKTLLGFNAQSHVIPLLPIQVYFDAELAKMGGLSNKQEVWWTSGLVYSIFIGTETSFEVSLPLVYSKNLKDIFNLNYNVVDISTGAISNPWQWYNMFQVKINMSTSELLNVLREAIKY